VKKFIEFLKSFIKNLDDEVAEKMPRALRVKSAPLSEIYFHLQYKGKVVNCAVENLSTTGLGLICNEMSLPLHKPMTGELELNGKKIPLKIKMTRTIDNFYGAQIMDGVVQYKNEIYSYYKMEFLASSLNKVDPKFLKKIEGEEIRWFFDGKNNELYYTVDQTGVISFHICFMLNYIEGGRNQKLRTGKVDEGQNKVMALKESNLIKFDTVLNEDVLKQARTIINCISELPPGDAVSILKFISQVVTDVKQSPVLRLNNLRLLHVLTEFPCCILE
jgi:hypothetical protein